MSSSGTFRTTVRNRKPPPLTPLPLRRGVLARPPAALIRAALALAIVVAVCGLAPAGLISGLAPAPVSASTTPKRLIALWWAERQTGKWYCYGGTGPSCFDCSGLVMKAYAHAGVTLPRTTYQMLSSRKLVRIPYSQIHRGDLAFYGRGHVELVTAWWHTTFGAADPGTRVGWHRWNAWWHPTMYFRLR